MNDYIIDKLTRYFIKGLEDPSNDNIDILRDGITVFVLNVPKTIALVFTAIFFNKLQTLIIVMLFYGIIRSFSKGIHAKTSWGCFIMGMLNYWGIALISPLFELSKISYNITFLICFILYAIYAPTVLDARPVGKTQHRNLKSASLITLAAYCLIGNTYQQTLGNIILLSVISQLICILPLTYKLTKQKRGGIYYPEETI